MVGKNEIGHIRCDRNHYCDRNHSCNLLDEKHFRLSSKSARYLFKYYLHDNLSF